MRTTVRLDEDLLSRAKALAARQGRTLTAVIEDGLREQVARATGTASASPVELPAFGDESSSPMPGVDLDDSAGLLELMEGGSRSAKRS